MPTGPVAVFGRLRQPANRLEQLHDVRQCLRRPEDVPGWDVRELARVPQFERSTGPIWEALCTFVRQC